jgi:hypothetical protein
MLSVTAMKNTIIEGARLQEVLREKVQTALCHQDVEVSETTEFYLVNLLDEFLHEQFFDGIRGPHADVPLAIMLLDASNKRPSERASSLKRVGDTSLVISGFFADSIRRGTVDLGYYISIGESAYLSLAEIMGNHKAFREIYDEMGHNFQEFVDVLAAVAPWNRPTSDAELLQIYERWVATGDDKLKELLDAKGISTEEVPSGKKH